MSDKRFSTPVNDVVEKEGCSKRPATIAFTQPQQRTSSRIRVVTGSGNNTIPRSKERTRDLNENVYNNEKDRESINTVKSVTFKGEKSKKLIVDEEEYPQKVYNRETLRQRYKSENYYTDTDSSDDEENSDRNTRSVWRMIAQIFTCCFPDRCIPRKTKDARQAWREKIAINCLIYIFSGILLFLFAVLPLLICPNDEIYTWEDINAQRNADWIVVHGDILDVSGYFNKHAGGIDPLRDYLGKDASLFFKRPELTEIKSECINLMTNSTIQKCGSESILGENINFEFKHCHSITNEDSEIVKLKTGELAYTYPDLEEPTTGQWIVIFDRVYNVTEYISKNQNYLTEKLHAIIKNKLKEDATEVYEDIYPKNETLSCMESLFFSGVLDTRYSLECAIINWIILISVGIVVIVMLAKFFTSLVSIGTKGYRERKKYVIINIPCYTEDKESLAKTINSVTIMDYSDEHKLLFIVCDGNLKGKGQSRTTPENVINKVLGNSINNETRTFTYASLGRGDKRQNLVKVYSGMYRYQNGKEEVHEVPYIVVVKIGFAQEALNGAGNRGKRDSQLILFNFLSKMFYIDQGVNTQSMRLTNLDEELLRRFNNLGKEVNKYEFILTVDADTEVVCDSLRVMVAHMNNKKILALCGETLVMNKTQNFITASQVYNYYLSHNFHKAFESNICNYFCGCSDGSGSVTCLPGCFSLYRLKFKGVHRDTPGLLNKEVLKKYSSKNVDTLHRKNLLELGEDRYLTSLLLKNFPHKGIIFVPEAKCKTIVPCTWSALKNQQIRWISSTVINNIELLTYKELKGVCCFSMRFIIMLDLISAFTLPASLIYLGYLIYLFITKTSMVSTLVIIVLGVIYAIQFLLFAIKRQYEYFIWMIIYIISIPMWWFILPLTAYWNIDRFTWSNRDPQKHKIKLKKTNSKYINEHSERENV